MDSKHWDWGKGFCRKHLGNGVPCQVCIATNDPDLERTREEWAALIGENPCKEVVGEYFDWKSVRPIGEPIKGSWSPGGTVNPQNIKKDFRIDGDTRVKGIFVAEGYDSDGKLVERIVGENTVSNKGFERMLGIDFSKLPKLPMSYCDPMTGHWIHTAGDPDAEPIFREDAEAVYLPPSREAAQNEILGQLYSEVRFKEPLTLHSGDTLLVSYTVKADDPNIEMRTRPLPLSERLALVAEQHRQRFIDAGIEEPDELLKMLGTEELIQPTIPGFELPKYLPRRVPVDMELIGTIIESEGCSDELRAALMAQISIYGAPTICGLLAQAGVDESFIDSLTSNLQR